MLQGRQGPRALATEFACQWLHIHDFDRSTRRASGTSRRSPRLRGAMYEETIRFFTDLFQRDGSVLEILDADHTFLNEPLAKHYGIPGVSGAEWRRVDGVKEYGRGGILGHGRDPAPSNRAPRGPARSSAATGCSRSLLGEKLPKPPKDVPQLPESELDTDGLTVRQLVEKHRSDESVRQLPRPDRPLRLRAGRLRRDRPPPRERPGRPADRHAGRSSRTAPSSTASTACATTCSRNAARTFLRQFCRKLLGYALGRGVQLSDEPLLDEMQQSWHADGSHGLRPRS